ncbi:hypothetical protein KO481_12915 [Nocardia sp. NEAU-G5]|uniref:Oxidoreductase n=1 Tax=Nocardia albiluteola TaxID=2842303 RepID=A0ABS6AWJ5_9NOCA|nr:hypothetical protein [Nocardia albiluteola]MBU3062421.1 hypothetical protein [Nocardia albiluteola]
MTLIRTPFGFESTAADVTAGLDLSGRRAVVTGATSVLLATAPQLAGVGGRYFADCNESETVDRRTGTLHGVARYALDPDGAQHLWELSEKTVTEGAK